MFKSFILASALVFATLGMQAVFLVWSVRAVRINPYGMRF